MSAATLVSPKLSTSQLLSLGALWLGVLVLGVYRQTLIGIGASWFDPNADMGHGLAVPFVVGYMVWSKKGSLCTLPSSSSYAGLILLAWGAIQFTVASAADWVFATRISVVISLVGCVWAYYGVGTFRQLAYPIAVLCLMIPPPTFLQQAITFPLQIIASRMAEASLDFLGYSVLREGNILELVGERLAVAEACSGIRSLYSLIFFGACYNFFFVRLGLIRWALLTALVPLALFGNAFRIVATGVVGQYDRALAHGILHETWGYITVFLAGGLVILLHLLILRCQVIFARSEHLGA